MRKFKIRIVSPQYPPETGGIETYAFNVAQELSSRGHDVEVLTLDSVDAETSGTVRVRPVLTGRSYLDHKTVHSGQKFDVVHVMNAAWAWVSRGLIPTFASVHGNDFIAPNPVSGPFIKHRFGLPFGDRLDFVSAKWWTRKSLKQNLKRCKTIFTNSEFTKNTLVTRYPALADRTVVGRLGLGEEFQTCEPSENVPNSPIRLITVSRLSEPRKNIDGVLRALSQLKEYQFQYDVVGDGSMLPELRELASRLGLEKRTQFHGRLSTEAMKRLLSNAHLFVLVPKLNLNSFEGFGIVYLEANACGTPVLAANVAGPAEAVREGVSGFFSSGSDLDAIAASLKQYFEGKYSFNSQACVEFAKSFSWCKLVNQFEAAYESSLTTRKP